MRKTRKAITEDELSEWLKINKIATAEDIMDTWRFEPRFSQFQWIGEIEHRHVLWGQPGKIGVTGYVTRGRFGRYADAIQLAQIAGGPADIAAVRRYITRTGLSLNVEQQLAADP